MSDSYQQYHLSTLALAGHFLANFEVYGGALPVVWGAKFAPLLPRSWYNIGIPRHATTLEMDDRDFH